MAETVFCIEMRRLHYNYPQLEILQNLNSFIIYCIVQQKLHSPDVEALVSCIIFTAVVNSWNKC